MKNDISSELDIYLLIDSFYEKVLKSPNLSFFFKHAIGNWPVHKQMFVKYWSKQILFTDTYDGSPLPAHIHVDNMYDRRFKKEHFEEWGQLWKETVNELFEGSKAKLAKEAGENMAKNIYLKMFVNRHPERV